MKRVKQITALYIIMSGLAAVLLSGCRDNPQDAAVKQLQRDTAAAIEQLTKDSDLSAANDHMRSILTGARTLGSKADASFLAAAAMQSAQAQVQRTSLPLNKATISEQIEYLVQNLKLLADLASQSQRTDSLIAMIDADAAALQKWIGSAQDPNTLKGKISLAQAQQQKLIEEKAPLEKNFSENQNKMLEIMNKADEMLRQAQRLEGQQRLDMENSAFDLLKTKNDYSFKAQAAESELSVIDSQLAIVEPHLKRLEADLAATEAKLQTLKTSQTRESLAAQKLQIATDMDALKTAFMNRIGTVKSQFESHLSTIDEIIALTDDAINNYNRVQSRELEYILNMVTGQTYMLAGSLTASKIQYTMALSDRIDGIFTAYQSVLPENIANPAASDPNNQETVQKAYEYFGQAIEAYENASRMSNSLRDDSKGAELAAIEGQILTVNNKIRLADRINDVETSQKAQADLTALVGKAKELDPAFDQSTTAMLVTKGLDFVPRLPIDTSMIFESIKKEFGNWRQLPLSEMEAEINRLAKRVEELKTEYAGDEQIIPFLEQESAAMEEQKTKGFAEEAVPVDEGVPSEDPNSMGGAFPVFPQN